MHDLEAAELDDGTLLVFCDPFCSELWVTEHRETGIPLPGRPEFSCQRLLGCAFCAWCGHRVVSDDECPLCPCPEERPWLGFRGRSVAEELFLGWRTLVGPTQNSNNLVVAALSGPIPDVAWAVAEDLLRIGGETNPRRIARHAFAAFGFRLPEGY